MGENLGDRVITGLAGVFALGVAFCPTTPTVTSTPKLRRNRIYLICAIVILASVAAAVITNFLPGNRT